jgi:hypothetical protein
VGRFPLHNDEPRDKRLFRISVSLADGIPDFAMRFDGSSRTYVVARGFMTMIVMDMRAAGRLHDPSGEGLILSPSTAVYIPIDAFCTYVSTSYIRSTSSTSRLSSGYGDGTAGILAGRRYEL